MAATIESGGWRRNPWRLVLWTVPTALIMTPAIMMQISDEWNWRPFAFVFWGGLLFGATGAIDLAIRKTGSKAYRLGVGLAVLTSFLLIWVNAVTGIIGGEDNPVNLIFPGVVLIAAAGSVVSRFQARGMARATLAATLALAAIAAMAPVFGWEADRAPVFRWFSDEPPGTAGLIMLIGLFATMWGLSSALFAKAARDRELG